MSNTTENDEELEPFEGARISNGPHLGGRSAIKELIKMVFGR